MYKEKLEKLDCNLTFAREDEFLRFLQELNSEDLHLIVKKGLIINLEYRNPGIPYPSIYKSCAYHLSDAQINEVEKEGAFIFTVMNHAELLAAVRLNLTTVPLSMYERAGLKCALVAKFLEEGMYEEYSSYITDGLKFFLERGSDLQLIIRSGNVIAMHSKKYKPVPEISIFAKASEIITDSFPKKEYTGASFNHSITKATYSLCNSRDAFMSEYAEAWEKAGLPKGSLDLTTPVLEFSTTETGEFPIKISPVLKIGSFTYPLGEKITRKHNGRFSLEEYGEEFKKAFSRMQDGITSLKELFELKLDYPMQTFIRAAREIGILGKAKRLCKEVYQDFQDTYYSESEVTAFYIYQSLCEVSNYTRFNEMDSTTKLFIEESLYRMLNIDWKKLDQPGPTEII